MQKFIRLVEWSFVFLSYIVVVTIGIIPVQRVNARASDVCSSPPNPIVAENCKTGTKDWHVTNYQGDITGFAFPTSVNTGESITFYIDSGENNYDLQVFRSGYYQGTGGRSILSAVDIQGKKQPPCRHDISTGLASCSNWIPSYTLATQNNWVSGVYLVKLVNKGTGGEGFIPFVVRNDEQRSDILLQLSVTTYQAYNNYGGKAVYSTISWDYCPTVCRAPRAVKVSFDRPNAIFPYNQNSYFWTDYPMVYWLEEQGYDVGYFTNIDTHASGKDGAKNLLLNHKTFLSVGHDEYWSQEMRNAVTQARDRGVNIGFFSSNVGYWRVRLEPDPWSGVPDRVMVTYKTVESGPSDPSGSPTSTWRDPQGINDPENGLIGIQYIGDNDGFYFPLRVTADQAQDPIYRNTGLQQMPPGTYVDIGRHLLGWEWDAVVDNGHTPGSLTILASSPVYGELLIDAGRKYQYTSATANVTRYKASSGAIVFAAGTNQWGWGLAIFEPDYRIQQITTNLFLDMGIRPATPAKYLVVDAAASQSGVSPQGQLAQDVDLVLVDGVEGLLRKWANPEFQFLSYQDGQNEGLANQYKAIPGGKGPVITNIQFSSNQDSISFTWVTDVPTNGQVWLKFQSGPVDFRLASENLGVRPIAGDTVQETITTDHRVTVSGLTPGREYFYHIAAMDQSGQVSITSEGTVKTRPASFTTQMKYWLQPFYRQTRCFYLAHKLAAMISLGIGLIFLVLCVVLVRNRVIRRRVNNRGQ